MTESSDFGSMLKRLRIRSGLTQKQLALQLGLSKSMISFYELRERTPSPEILVRMAAVFQVSTDYLLGTDKTPRLDVSGLDEEDVEVVSDMVDLLRKKNRK